MEGERRGFGAGVWMNGPANAGEMAQEAVKIWKKPEKGGSPLSR